MQTAQHFARPRIPRRRPCKCTVVNCANLHCGCARPPLQSPSRPPVLPLPGARDFALAGFCQRRLKVAERKRRRSFHAGAAAAIAGARALRAGAAQGPVGPQHARRGRHPLLALRAGEGDAGDGAGGRAIKMITVVMTMMMTMMTTTTTTRNIAIVDRL